MAMTFTVYSLPGRRPWIVADSSSPRGAGRISLSPSSGLAYRTRYDVTRPSGESQEMVMEVESTLEKVRSVGRPTAAGREERSNRVKGQASSLHANRKGGQHTVICRATTLEHAPVTAVSTRGGLSPSCPRAYTLRMYSTVGCRPEKVISV